MRDKPAADNLRLTRGFKEGEINADGQLVDYAYNNAGRLTRIDRPNGTYRLHEYDAASQLQLGLTGAPRSARDPSRARRPRRG